MSTTSRLSGRPKLALSKLSEGVGGSPVLSGISSDGRSIKSASGETPPKWPLPLLWKEGSGELAGTAAVALAARPPTVPSPQTRRRDPIPEVSASGPERGENGRSSARESTDPTADRKAAAKTDAETILVDFIGISPSFRTGRLVRRLTKMRRSVYPPPAEKPVPSIYETGGNPCPFLHVFPCQNGTAIPSG